MRSLGLKSWMAPLAILAIAAIVATVLVVEGITVGARDPETEDFRAGRLEAGSSRESDLDILIAETAEEFEAGDFRAGQMAGLSAEEPDSEIVIAKVGESSISLADFKQELHHVEYAKSVSQRELDGLGPETGAPTEYLEARHGTVLKWGSENAALANLVMNLALLEEARALGLSATDEQVTENMAMARAAYENGEYDPYNQGFVAGIGEDAYWEAVYPGKAAMALSIGNLHDHVTGGAVLYRDAKALRVDFTEGVLAKTVITLPASDHHSTTVENVLGFLADVREVDRASLLIPSEHLATAPADTWVVIVKLTDGKVETTKSSKAATVCTGEDADGKVSRWICDEATRKERIASLDDAVTYMIVEPGNLLPVFDE